MQLTTVEKGDVCIFLELWFVCLGSVEYRDRKMYTCIIGCGPRAKHHLNLSFKRSKT